MPVGGPGPVSPEYGSALLSLFLEALTRSSVAGKGKHSRVQREGRSRDEERLEEQ